MENKNTVIKVENLSKQYRLGEVGTGTLSHDLSRWWHKVRGKNDPFLKIGETNDRTTKSDNPYVWALKDINFEVQKGEVLGIIGKNGAGKSTLLKLLSRVTSPTTGLIKAKGRIASLLEVGTGFHPEMTGRENIFMNGTIMGMNRHEIKAKLAEIAAFAGVDRYLDTPVKRYSSGMTVRLGFAIAAHLDPEILIVDEVLAVGDAEFQKKAIGKMQDVSKEEGRTVLFVSHNMAAVKNLCSQALVLNNGRVAFEGQTDESINFYLHNNNHNSEHAELIWIEKHPGQHEFKLHSICLKNDRNELTSNFQYDNDINIHFKYELLKPVRDLRINFRLLNDDETILLSSSTDLKGFISKEAGSHHCIITIPSRLLNERKYSIFLQAGIPNVRQLLLGEIFTSFTVEKRVDKSMRENTTLPGYINDQTKWTL